MPLDPLAQEFLAARDAAGVRPVTELSVEAARQQSIRLIPLAGAPEPVASVADRMIPGPAGAIPIRIYKPAGAAPLPVVVEFHGGGWVLGNLDTVDILCRQLANGVPCAVVSVNYRHAPEHRFPAAAEDAYAATRWVYDHAEELGVDATRVAVAGQSAGGNLAAAVALMARDRGGPPIVLQHLNVPVINYDFSTASYAENAEGYGLTTDAMRWYWDSYLADPADGAHPYASPLRAASLARLPPAHVVTTELDPLRDEGNAYADRLRAEGVPVTHKCYAGFIHGFAGPEAWQDTLAAFRVAFGLE